ncbi:MAG TPA: hypothetical protein VFL99_17900 [Segeticoccus sp.]|uniref:hypothetical protein n=1 Tax=Segeticoccus sp. TaxID=2706531 RepID=UPI002D80653C|nr:hypothetical protein [Segeticoccus sp.]HET8602202.1 hypothetical protein [Segeticoccus sp.]
MATHRPSLLSSLVRGTLAGLTGGAFVGFAGENFDLPHTGDDWADRLTLGAQWGLAHALAARRGLHGIPAIGAVFAAVYGGDLALSTALGRFHPEQWDQEDWTADVLDKLVLATAAGLAYHLLFAPRRRPEDEEREQERERRRRGHQFSGPVAIGPTPTTSWGH